MFRTYDFVRRGLGTALLAGCVCLSACSATSFSGSGRKGEASSTPAPSPKTTEGETSSPSVADTPDDSGAPETTGAADLEREEGNAPGGIDISSEGFKCVEDMSAAVGPWRGEWAGTGPLGGMSGSIDMTFQLLSKSSIDIKDYRIVGGYGGASQLESIAINFVLSCGAPEFQPVQVQYWQSYAVTMRFTHQTWSPPTLKGTWDAVSTDGTSFLAKGTWSIRKR